MKIMIPIAFTTAAAALLVSGMVLGTASAKQPEKKPDPGKTEPVFLNAGEIKWGDAPPDIPRGAQIAVLSGDPSKKVPFTMRFKMPAGYRIPAHWHSSDEHLTVLSGTFALHMGDTLDAPAHDLQPGAYHFLPGKMHHAAEAKGETILQVHGIGPFDIHYLNPADNPNKAAMVTPPR
jgi:quercetin dioxygenase-like cupin family protein